MQFGLIYAFLLGLIGGVIPGPVLAATFTEILHHSFHRSLRIISWALFAETVVALCSLFIFQAVIPSEAVFKGISFIGVIILLWIAVSVWKIRGIGHDVQVHFGFGKIMLMVFSNGVLWSFWITVCVPQAIMLNEKILFGSFWFLAMVQLGWFISTIIVAFVFSKFRKLLIHPSVMPILFKIFSLTFFFFAFRMLYESVMYFWK